MEHFDDMDLAARVFLARTTANLGKKELADLVPCSPSAVTQWENGATKTLKGKKLIGLARATGFRADWLETGRLPRRSDEPEWIEPGDDRASVPLVHFRLSAGVSGFAVDVDAGAKKSIFFNREWFEEHGYKPKDIYAVKVTGDSMEPSLWDGDLVVIHTADTTPKDGEVFALNFEGEMVIKRLRRDGGEWWAASDNADQRRYAPKKCNGHVLIVGRVVYRQTERI